MPIDDGRRGQRFCVFHPAQGSMSLGSILYIHPFAEEMNKSRRMAALQARALARAGYAVLQLDLLGCGDSSGDFGDASWNDWIMDVVQACNWLSSRGHARLWLWGLRSGCFLAAEAARQLAYPCDYLFWAPATAGKLLLQQFLRIEAAAGITSGNAKNATESLRRQLAAGVTVEVAGYALSPGLANGLEQAVLTPPERIDTNRAPRRVEWLELSTSADATLSPISVKTCDQWRQAGHSIRSQVVNGPSFWRTTEIEDAPALIIASVAAMAPVEQLVAV